MAIDNTLGPNSPNSGRIYATFVGYLNIENPIGTFNPISNTDVFLTHSDDGGRTWSRPTEVNADASTSTGYTQSSHTEAPGGFKTQITGRTQFMPEVAVDQATGTVVSRWRDSRDDAAGAGAAGVRVATYLTTSIDGGQTFGPATYANPRKTAVDAITGQTNVMGPAADMQGGGDGQTDTPFGYGTQMGLAVFDGKLYPMWSGNFQGPFSGFGNFYNSFIKNGAVTGYPLNLWYQPMVIAAGPRVVTSSMGPIPLAAATGGSVSISVVFDRPIDPASVKPGDAQVFYHDAIKTSDPSIPLQVTGFAPTGGGTSPTTRYTITFNPSKKPDGTSSGITNFTGTYSYLIAPDDGAGTSISAPVWSFAGPGGTLRKFDPADQNADGTSDQNAVTTAFFGLTPGDVYATPSPQPTSPVTFQGAFGTGGNYGILQAPFNQNTLPLIVPGPQLSLTSVPGGSGSSNLVLNGTNSSLSVTFDRPMQVSTFTPGQVLQIMGPAGSVSGPQYFASDSVGQTIPAASSATSFGTLNSTVTVPSFGGTFKAAKVTVQLNAAFSANAGLSAYLDRARWDTGPAVHQRVPHGLEFHQHPIRRQCAEFDHDGHGSLCRCFQAQQCTLGAGRQNG